MKKAKPNKKKPFLTDIKTLRRRAREHLERGAVTRATARIQRSW